MIFPPHRELPATRKKKKKESLKLSCWLRSRGWSYFLICDPLKSFPHILSAFRSANLASVQLDKNKLCSTNKRRNWKIHHTKLIAPRNPNIYAYIYTCICVYIYIYILPNVSCALSLNVQWYLAEWMTWAVGRYFHTWTLYEPGEMQEWWAIG